MIVWDESGSKTWIEYLRVFVMTHVTCQVPQANLFWFVDYWHSEYILYCSYWFFCLSSLTTTVKHIKEIQRFSVLHHRFSEGSIYLFSHNELSSVLLIVCTRMWLVCLPLYTTLTLSLYQVSTATLCILQAKARPVYKYSQMNLRQYWKYPVWEVLNVCKVFVHV